MRLILALILIAVGPIAMAAGSGGGAQMPRTVVQTPEQAATSHYKSGLRYKKRAWKQEEKAATAKTPEQRDKLLAKAAKNFEKAVGQQVKAVKANGRHHEAANELGYALRRLGRHEQAIKWYDHALQLQPGFLEAIEYRGEAYLAIGQLDAAKEAYMELFRNDPSLAEQLLGAMEAWVGEQESGVEGAASSAAVGEFSKWVTERKSLAGLTSEVSLNQSRQW